MNKFDNPNIEQDVENPVESIRKENKTIVSYEKAREIMGDQFLGIEKVKERFNDVEVEEIPEIPYDEAVLEKAKETGCYLILRVDAYQDGSPITIESMQNKMRLRNLRFKSSSILDLSQELFFKKEHPNLEWKIFSGLFGLNENYFEQTLDIYKLLDSINALTEEEKNEFPSEENVIEYLDQISKEVKIDWKGGNGYDGNSNWRNITKQLQEMRINKLHRRRAVEFFYDELMTLRGGRSISGNVYECSNSRLNDGRFVIANDGFLDVEAGPHPAYQYLFHGARFQF